MLERAKIILLLFAVTLLTFANTLPNDFVWDDDALVKNNSYIHNSTYIAATFTSDLAHDSHQGTAYYRPLQTITYMADYFFWGLNPFGYHLTNLLLHLACVLLVWFVASRFTSESWRALVVALIFAVQPLNTSAVSYISGRADSLALAGMLSSVLFLLRYRDSDNRQILHFAASLVCYGFALFSRENAMLFPALVFLTTFVIEDKNWRRALDASVPFVIIAVTFVAWRLAVLQLVDKPVITAWAIPFDLRAKIFFRALATYCGLLLCPAHLQMEREVVSDNAWTHFLTVIGVICFFAVAGALRWSATRSKPALLGLCWFAVALLPMVGTLNLVATAAEHWLYVPMIGFYLAMISLLPRRPALQWLCATAVLALAARSVTRNQDWANNAVLFAQTTAAAHNSERAKSNYGHILYDEGQTTASLLALLEAERLNPLSTIAKFNLAVVYMSRGEEEKGRQKLNECVTIDPTNKTAWLLVARYHACHSHFSLAQRYYRIATIYSRGVDVRLEYGEFLVHHNRLKEALAVTEECFQLEPGNAEVFKLLGKILKRGGQPEKATEAFRVAASLDRHAGT